MRRRETMTGELMRRRKLCDGEKPCDSVTLTMKEQQRGSGKNHGTAVCRMEKREVFCNLGRLAGVYLRPLTILYYKWHKSYGI